MCFTARWRTLLDAVENLLVREARIESLLGETGLLGDREQRRHRLFHRPLPLLAEQRVDHGEILVRVVLAGAARQHEGGGSEIVERKFAENVTHLAGVDVLLLDFRETSSPGNARNAGRSSMRIR